MRASIHYDLGVLFMLLGRTDEEVEKYRDALRLEPDMIPALVNLSRRLVEQGKPDEAVALYKNALAFNQKCAENHHNFGILLKRLGKFDEALAEDNEALRLLPEAVPWRNDLACDLATHPDPNKRQPSKALELASQVVETEPDHAEYWNTLGIARYRIEDWSGSIDALKKSVELSSGGTIFDWLFLSMAYCQIKQVDESRQWYDKATGWIDKNRNHPFDEYIQLFRAEAKQLLGVGVDLLQESSLEGKGTPGRKKGESSG